MVTDNYWEYVGARASEAWRELLIEGEHTLPDGSTIRRTPTGDYRIGGAPFSDLSAVYELLVDDPRSFDVVRAEVSDPDGHDAGASLLDEVKKCIEVPCPPFVETTIRAAQPVVPPPWVSAALDRIERDWSNHLQGRHPRHATAPPGYRVTTVPALAGGYWTMQVPDEPPLIVETLCERCIEAAGAWQP